MPRLMRCTKSDSSDEQYYGVEGVSGPPVDTGLIVSVMLVWPVLPEVSLIEAERVAVVCDAISQRF